MQANASCCAMARTSGCRPRSSRVSLAAADNSRLTVQSQQVASFRVLPEGDSSRAEKIPLDVENVKRLTLTLDNKIIYSTSLAGNEGVRMVGLTGTDSSLILTATALSISPGPETELN
jgi:hypothetical protein